MLRCFLVMSQPELQFRIGLFLAVWGLLAAGAVVFYWKTKDPQRKQKALPWIASVFGAVFFGMAYFLGLPVEALPFIAVVVVAIVFMNVRAIRFCAKCGAYNPNQPMLRARFCRSCGTSLEKTPL